jgi:streptogramin lyase
VTLIAGSGAAAFADGQGSNAAFMTPIGVVVDTNGVIFVADYDATRIRKISSAGFVSTLAGHGTTTFINGMGTEASFNNPRGVALDPLGNVYVGESEGNRVRMISTAGEDG